MKSRICLVLVGLSWVTIAINPFAAEQYRMASGQDLPSSREVEVYNNRGLSWASEGEYDKAIEALGIASGLDPGNATIHFNLGSVWRLKGELDKAIASYNRAIELKPWHVKAYSDRGLCWHDKGELDKAMADYNRAIELDPRIAQAYSNRGCLWDDLGKHDKAMADHNRAVELDPRNVQAYNNLGFCWQQKGEHDKAMADYNRAIALDPRYSVAYTNRGLLWHELGEHDKAMADHDRAVELDARNAQAYNNRGYCWQHKGEHDKAMADYNRAIELDPRYGKAYGNRGLLWDELGEHDKAMADHNRAVELEARNVLVYNNRGYCWQQKGEDDKAMADYNRAIALDPRCGEAYTNRGCLWSYLGEYEKAIADLTRAIGLFPENPTRPVSIAHSNRGYVLAEIGHDKSAISDFDRAIRLWSDNHLAYANRAQCKRKYGDYDGAMDDISTALKLVPRDGSYRMYLAWLQATCPNARYRDGKAALENATTAYELVRESQSVLRMWKFFESLAAAHAENGDFKKACEWQEKAVASIATEKFETDDNRQACARRLSLYRQAQPYREQPRQPSQQSPDGFSPEARAGGSEVGFVSLFDGRSLKGWKGPTKYFRVEDGVLVADFGQAYGGVGDNLFTDTQYRNFILRFDYRMVSRGCNSGILLRSPATLNPLESIEFQIIDDAAFPDLKPYQSTASLYGMSIPNGRLPNPLGHWNSVEIVCEGRNVRGQLNGRQILDVNLSLIGDRCLDGRNHPGAQREEGYVGINGAWSIGRVEFRNIRIKEISPQQ